MTRGNGNGDHVETSHHDRVTPVSREDEAPLSAIPDRILLESVARKVDAVANQVESLAADQIGARKMRAKRDIVIDGRLAVLGRQVDDVADELPMLEGRILRAMLDADVARKLAEAAETRAIKASMRAHRVEDRDSKTEEALTEIALASTQIHVDERRAEMARRTQAWATAGKVLLTLAGSGGLTAIVLTALSRC